MVTVWLDQESSDDCLGKTNFEILYEVFEVSLVAKVVAPWKELVDVDLVSKHQCP